MVVCKYTVHCQLYVAIWLILTQAKMSTDNDPNSEQFMIIVCTTLIPFSSSEVGIHVFLCTEKYSIFNKCVQQYWPALYLSIMLRNDRLHQHFELKKFGEQTFDFNHRQTINKLRSYDCIQSEGQEERQVENKSNKHQRTRSAKGTLRVMFSLLTHIEIATTH